MGYLLINLEAQTVIQIAPFEANNAEPNQTSTQE